MMYLIPVSNGFHLVPESNIEGFVIHEDSIQLLYTKSAGGGYHVIANKHSSIKPDVVLDDQAFRTFKKGILESVINFDPYVYTKCRDGSTKVRIDGEDVDALGGAGKPARSLTSSGESFD